MREALLDRGPAGRRVFQETLGIGREGIAVFLAAEQIEPLAGDHPKSRVTRISHPSPQIDRIVTAKLRGVDLGMGHERGAVALVAEAPDGAGLGGLEIGDALGRLGIGKIGDRIEPLDREAGIAVDHHPLGGCGKGGQIKAENAEKACPQGENGHSGAPTVSFLPLCRHSCYR